MFSSNTTQVSDGGYQISRSLRFNSADSAYLNRTPATTTNRQIWTWSGWVKRGKLGVYGRVFQAREGSTGNQFFLRFNNTDTIFVTGDSGSYTLETTQVFRDPSAWYHIVFACDTTQATSSNRFKLYVNGSQVTAFGTATYPSQNLNTTVNSAFPHGLGAETSGPSEFFDGYITETYLIDGSQLTPSSFGETNAQTGVWQPKAYAGSYGTNGFYLNFSDNSNTTAATLGKDYSGNGNNWTPNNFSVTAGAGNDSLVDSPTSYGTDTGVGGTVRGNYCTLNPLFFNGVTTIVPTNGNLDFTFASAANRSAYGTIGMSSGKWYCEVVYTTLGGSPNPGLSLVTQADTSSYVGAGSAQYSYDSSGVKINNNSSSAYGASWNTSNVVGIAFDADAGTLTFYKDGTSQGTAFTGLTAGTYVFGVTAYGGGTGNINFGQRPFAYTAPSGFKALCTQNLPTPTIGATTATQANTFFTPNVYAGNNGTQTVTNSIDTTNGGGLVWFKNRTSALTNYLINSGSGYTKYLASNNTDAEGTFDFGFTPSTTGFSFTQSSATLNATGSNYVAWQWKANGSGSTNTAGSITSTVSANTTAGFSVVTYTNASSGTVGHGLGVAPAMVIYKDRTNVTNWVVLHQSLTNMSNYYLKLNLTDAVATGITLGGNPTSSVIYTNTNIIQNGAASVAYCFAEIAGYSKFGSYTGNGSADGPFVFTGFRPRFIMIKRTDSTANWYMYDTARSPSNVTGTVLFADGSFSEADIGPTNYLIDIDSNGYKLRNNYASVNASGGTYIFMAIAETPFKFALAR